MEGSPKGAQVTDAEFRQAVASLVEQWRNEQVIDPTADAAVASEHQAEVAA